MEKNPKNRRVTLKDVAEAANVSVMTVSNVVNGRLEYVSERTRVSVQREIERLNYRTVDTARALRTGETKTIGTLIVLNPLEDRFGSRELDVAFRSFAHQTGEKGFRVTLKSRPRAAAQDGLGEFSSSVDGVCVLSLDDHVHCRLTASKIAELGKPVIVCAPKGEEDFDERMMAFVDDESFSAGERLAAELIENGVTKLILLDSNFVSASVRERIKGLSTETTQRGMVVENFVTPHGSKTAIVDQLETRTADFQQPTCIVALNEVQAQAVLIDLTQRGYSVPQDIQVACLNLNPAKPYRSPDGRSDFPSMITGIWSDSWRIGSAAATALLSRLQTGTFPFHYMSVACTIKVGTTTGRVVAKPVKSALP